MKREPKEAMRPFWGAFPTWAAAASVGVALALGFMSGFYTRTPTSTSETEIAGDHSIWVEVPDVRTDWKNVTASCTLQSGQRQSCDLLASAAQLQLASVRNTSQQAAPVVVAALRSSGVSPSVVTHVEGALDTRPAPSTKTHEELKALEASLNTAQVNPTLYLELAKLRFANGDTLKGYESLTSYVATDNAAAGKALRLGFVEPIKTVNARRPRTFELTPAHNSGTSKPTTPAQQEAMVVATEAADDNESRNYN
jgi:hypothetical protein